MPGFFLMFDIPLAAAVNRLLRRSSWTAERLTPHAGKTVALSCGPVEAKLTVCASGEVTAAPGHTPDDARNTVTPGALLRLAARDPEAWSAVEVTGDLALAGVVDDLARNLRWDYEEDLSRVFGDIAAHRMGETLRGLERWGRTAVTNVGLAAAEYATYEQPALASAGAVETFVRVVDEVRDDVERLAKRVEAIERRIGAGAPPASP